MLKAEAKEYTIWDGIPPEKPFGSFEAMLKAELGIEGEEQADKTKAMLMSADPNEKPQPTLSESMRGNKNARKKNKNSVVLNKAVSGVGSTNVPYLVRRLKRDAPSVAKDLADDPVITHGSSGFLCVNGRPLREGVKAPAVLHRLGHVG